MGLLLYGGPDLNLHAIYLLRRGAMSRTNMNNFKALILAFAVTSLMTLGACSSGKGTDTLKADDSVGEAQTETAQPESVIEEDIKQAGARDPGYADSSSLVDINFDFDRSEIRDDQKEALTRNAEWIQNNGDTRIQIEGHCDERGTEEYNLALGERRANTVRDYLISYGIDPARLYTISYGEELPINPEHTEDAWAQNRRSHFLVTN